MGENGHKGEQRKHARTNASQWQTLWIGTAGNESDWIAARLIDHSTRGLGVEVSTPLTAGSQVLVKGNLGNNGDGAHRQMRAQVRWCLSKSNGSYRAGLALAADVHWAEDTQQETKAEAAPEPEAEPDYYDVLQLSPKADPDTLHRVYRILAQRYHPDNAETGNEDMFKLVLTAYQVLSNPELRAAYDVRRHSGRQARWRIFDQAEAATGAEGERRKRMGILSLLYTQRINEPDAPSLTAHDFEDLLGCPREHLEVSLWYLKEKGWISRSDNGRYVITAEGFDQAENSGVAPPIGRQMLPAPAETEAPASETRAETVSSPV